MVNHTLKGMPSILEYLTVIYFSKYINSILKERDNWKGDISDFGWYGTSEMQKGASGASNARVKISQLG